MSKIGNLQRLKLFLPGLHDSGGQTDREIRAAESALCTSVADNLQSPQILQSSVQIILLSSPRHSRTDNYM
jgi:hypothetical protein